LSIIAIISAIVAIAVCASSKVGPGGKDGKDGTAGKPGASGKDGPEGKQGLPQQYLNVPNITFSNYNSNTGNCYPVGDPSCQVDSTNKLLNFFGQFRMRVPTTGVFLIGTISAANTNPKLSYIGVVNNTTAKLSGSFIITKNDSGAGNLVIDTGGAQFSTNDIFTIMLSAAPYTI